MDTSTPLEIIRTLYGALTDGDVSTVRPLLDPAIEWTEAEGFPLAGTFHGPDAVIKGVLMRLAGEWDGFETAAEEFVDGGGTIVVLGRYSGTYKETGKSFTAPFAHVWTVRDGRAVRYVQYTDTWLVQQALR
jgi:ketosteroid isomerase-like protein